MVEQPRSLENPPGGECFPVKRDTINLVRHALNVRTKGIVIDSELERIRKEDKNLNVFLFKWSSYWQEQIGLEDVSGFYEGAAFVSLILQQQADQIGTRVPSFSALKTPEEAFEESRQYLREVLPGAHIHDDLATVTYFHMKLLLVENNRDPELGNELLAAGTFIRPEGDGFLTGALACYLYHKIPWENNKNLLELEWLADKRARTPPHPFK